MTTARQPFVERKIRLIAHEQLDRAIAVLSNAPLDPAKPLEFVLREEVKGRKQSQNDLMWSGPLKDISEQVYVNRRTYSDKIWHEYFKALYLPDEFDAELCKEGYAKWDDAPDGGRVMVGSTKQLTVKGMAQYLDQVHAFGGNQGVEFHEPPQRGKQG